MSVRRSRASELRRRARRRRERHRVLKATVITAGVTVAIGATFFALGAVRGPERAQVYCVQNPADFPAQGIAGWDGDQLDNAALIIQAAQQQGLGRDAQVLGVMAAMGESSLHNINYGDWETSGVTNPDGTRTSSIGLFQQQEWWGSAAERLDPATAAGKFYAKLQKVRGWQQMTPTHAIHRVQINANPEHYARFHDDAVAVIEALSGECVAAKSS